MNEITENTVGLWYMSLTDTSDWLCCVNKMSDKEYSIRYRFRYYKDDNAHNSEDVKNWYSVIVKEDSFEKMIEQMRKVATLLGETADTEYDEILMQNGDVDQFMLDLMSKEWAHVRIKDNKK